MNNNLLPLLLLIVFFGNNTNLHAQKKPSVFEQIIKKVEDKIIPPKPAVKKEITKKPTTKTKSPSLSKGKTKPLNRASAEEYGWIEIPVVFHFVHDDEINKQEIHTKISTLLIDLNEGFKKADIAKIETEYQKDIGSPNIKFVYASEKFATCGIVDLSFHETKISAFEAVKFPINKQLKFQFEEENKILRSYGYLDSKLILNIWIVNFKNKHKDILGYSSFPVEKSNTNDGVVLSEKVLDKERTIRKAAIVHEVGHWLGLYHIWGAENTDCYSAAGGDYVKDTPRVKEMNTNKNVENGIIQEACFSNKNSNYENYMDYSYVYGMFTHGQVDRMRSQIKKYRPELLLKKNCPESNTITGTQVTNTNAQNQSGYADVCIKNKTRFKRRVVLTHRKSNYKKELLIALSIPPNPKTACTYDIPAGVYRCQVYTTITGSLIEDFEVRLNIGDNTPIPITANGN